MLWDQVSHPCKPTVFNLHGLFSFLDWRRETEIINVGQQVLPDLICWSPPTTIDLLTRDSIIIIIIIKSPKNMYKVLPPPKIPLKFIIKNEEHNGLLSRIPETFHICGNSISVWGIINDRPCSHYRPLATDLMSAKLRPMQVKRLS